MPYRVELMPTVLNWIWRSCQNEMGKSRRVGVGASVEYAHTRFKNCHKQRHIAFIFLPRLCVFLWCKLINPIADSIDKSLEFGRLTANMSNLKKNWKYEEVQALIHLVRKYPSLYDRRDPDYNQARTKEVNIPLSIHPCKFAFSSNLSRISLTFRIYGKQYQHLRHSKIKMVSVSVFSLLMTLDSI